MNWIQEIEQDTDLSETLSIFLTNYGISGLVSALHLYTDMQQEYICKTKTSTARIKLGDIYYLEIHGHNIIAYTSHGLYRKYGTLTAEQKLLSRYGFIKCNQSCLVSLCKINSICNNQIILVTGEKLHLSRSCAPIVIMAFHTFNQK